MPRKQHTLVGGFALATLLLAAPAFAQPAGGDPNQPRRFDPQQFQKMLSDRMKDVLGSTDEEWTALEPRVSKVMTMQMQLNNIGQSVRMLFRRPQADGSGAADPNAGRPRNPFDTQSEVGDRAKELQEAVEKKDVQPPEIKAKLAALREARTKARSDLARAQQELRELVTLKQEAILVGMGLLD